MIPGTSQPPAIDKRPLPKHLSGEAGLRVLSRSGLLHLLKVYRNVRLTRRTRLGPDVLHPPYGTLRTQENAVPGRLGLREAVKGDPTRGRKGNLLVGTGPKDLGPKEALCRLGDVLDTGSTDWTDDPSKPLIDLLVEKGNISGIDMDVLEVLTEAKSRGHEGNAG